MEGAVNLQMHLYVFERWNFYIFKCWNCYIFKYCNYFLFQIKEETGTKIDLPSENSDSDVISITGKKANVEEAKIKIEAIQKELVSVIYFWVSFFFSSY